MTGHGASAVVLLNSKDALGETVPHTGWLLTITEIIIDDVQILSSCTLTEGTSVYVHNNRYLKFYCTYVVLLLPTTVIVPMLLLITVPLDITDMH